jgi:hypothetical protein
MKVYIVGKHYVIDSFYYLAGIEARQALYADLSNMYADRY